MESSISPSEFAECRWDPFYRRWVILSPRRAARPNARGVHAQPAQACPFCPGNENQTPPVQYAERASSIDGYPWHIRVFDNLYGVVEREISTVESEAQAGIPPGARRLPARGIHEIIVETPVHDKHPADYSDEEMAAVFLAYQNRLTAAWSEPGIASVLIFKNHGREAGASLQHGHSQLMALPFVFPLAPSPGDDCLLCSVIRAEQAGPRKIASQNSLLAWSPYASANPYEAWIAPASHASDFLTLDYSSIFLIAVMARDLVRGLRHAIGEIPYNLVLHATPKRIDALNHPWRIEVIPRTAHMAGFELGTGCGINSVPPELAAADLRHHMREMGYLGE